MSNKKQLTVYKSINDTIAFYFEKVEGTGTSHYALMCPIRMAYIFNRGLKSGQLTQKRKDQIKDWFKLMSDKKIRVEEEFTIE